MRIPSRARPRRSAARIASLALVLALAHGATGCAHQLSNAEFAAGVVTIAAIAGAAVMLSGCNELTMQCRTPEGRIVRPGPSFPSSLVVPPAMPGR